MVLHIHIDLSQYFKKAEFSILAGLPATHCNNFIDGVFTLMIPIVAHDDDN